MAALVLGSAGAIGLQVHAQQNSVAAAPVAQVQGESAMGGQESVTAGIEAKDGAGVDESLPGGGHQDPAGSVVDHQFEGVE